MPEHLILADLHCLHLYPLGVSVREIRCCSTTRPDLRSRSPTWNSQSLFRWLDNIVVVHGEKYCFRQLPTVEGVPDDGMYGENPRSTVPGRLGGSLCNTRMDIPCVGAGFPLLVSVADVVSNQQ